MKGLESFVSEYRLNLHKEYINNERLKLSVLEKSFPSVRGRKLHEITRMRLTGEDKKKIMELKESIILHDLYFSSFCEPYSKSDFIRNNYSSEASFLYSAYKRALDSNGGFLIFGIDRGKPVLRMSAELNPYDYTADFISAIDIDEHAYFGDYGFNRDEYLRNALMHLDLRKFDIFSEKD